MGALEDEFVSMGWRLPDFQNSNLGVAKQLMQSDHGSLIGNSRNKVFIIIDGMGYKIANDTLNKRAGTIPDAKWLGMRQITSIFPSTTGNVLSSIYSGMPTSEHGVVGTKVPFKEAGMMINVLGFSAALGKDLKLWRVDPKTFYPKPKMIDGLKKRGSFRSLLNENILGTGLSTAVFGYGDVQPFIALEDMLISIREHVRSGTRYIFAYYDMLDHMQHQYGPYTEQTEALMSGILSAIGATLRQALEKHGYDLIITADHGQASIPHKNDMELKSDDEMLKFLQMPPWGEPRALFLHVIDGKERMLEDYFSRKLGKHAMLVESEEAIKAGLFGDKEVDDDLRYRFGTHIIMPYDNFAVPYKYPNTSTRMKERPPMLGMHGGLTDDEMLIPLLTNF